MVTWEIVNPRKIIVDRGEAEVDIGFRRVTISYVTLSCSRYLYYNTFTSKFTLYTLKVILNCNIQ